LGAARLGTAFVFRLLFAKETQCQRCKFSDFSNHKGTLTGFCKRASAKDKATSATTATMKRTIVKDSAYPHYGKTVPRSVLGLRRLNLFRSKRFRDVITILFACENLAHCSSNSAFGTTGTSTRTMNLSHRDSSNPNLNLLFDDSEFSPAGLKNNPLWICRIGTQLACVARCPEVQTRSAYRS
jgi:hypothetical protein